MSLPGLLKTHSCGELTLDHQDQEVQLCGWVHRKRDLGGLFFIDIRDKYGVTQLNFEQYEEEDLRNIPLESVIQVGGFVKARPQEALNTEMITGQVELQVNKVNVLATSQEPPFLPEGKVEASEDLKLKYRYLQLRSQKLQKILSLRSQTAQQARELLTQHQFTEVETPILYKTTPEGARDYIVPSRVHAKKVYALPQSPQILKQLLMMGGTDRYFQLCRCFRDEDLRADRQPEFTQVDIEASFCTEETLKALARELIKKWFSLPESFELKTLNYAEAMSSYGSDKPDLRFGLKHHPVTEFFKDSAFGLFQSLAAEGGLIKAIFLPQSQGVLSRKEIDALVEVVKPYGGKGVAWFKIQGQECSGGISKFIDSSLLAKFQELQAEENGLWLFCGSPQNKVSHDCANAVRLFLGKHFNLYQEQYSFAWINEFPLLEWDEGRFFALHHPFTSPHAKDREAFLTGTTEDLKNVRAQAYDLVCNGYELGGGSIRISNQSLQNRMFECLGMSEQEQQQKFGFFLEALQYGTPPHGGIAFGLDRIVMLQAGTDNIRDVIAFPKTTAASDLMSGAPSECGNEQLKELSLSWT